MATHQLDTHIISITVDSSRSAELLDTLGDLLAEQFDTGMTVSTETESVTDEQLAVIAAFIERAADDQPKLIGTECRKLENGVWATFGVYA